MKRVSHYLSPGEPTTACGQIADPAYTTAYMPRVTCKQCLRALGRIKLNGTKRARPEPRRHHIRRATVLPPDWDERLADARRRVGLDPYFTRVDFDRTNGTVRPLPPQRIYTEKPPEIPQVANRDRRISGC